MKTEKNTEKINLTLRIGEGGSDSKLLLKDMMDIYTKSARNKGFGYKVEDSRDGHISI